MHIVLFLPRDAMHSVDMQSTLSQNVCLSVCLSVCPSHTSILNISSNFSNSHNILVFSCGNILTAGSLPPYRGRRMQRGMKKIAIFDQYLALFQKWYKIGGQEVIHSSYLNHGVLVIFAVIFFAERVINIWNSLPSTVNFSTLASFRRTFHNVDFSRFLKCS